VGWAPSTDSFMPATATAVSNPAAPITSVGDGPMTPLINPFRPKQGRLKIV
jgi:hypothetical protein